jgi:hypothetical protein
MVLKLTNSARCDAWKEEAPLGGTATTGGVVISEIFDSTPGARNIPHPTRALPGEELPTGYSRSYAGLLLRDHNREIVVDQDVVK